MKTVFATNNQHKLEEVRQILGTEIEVLSLEDIGCHEDIPETGTTLEENALQKADYVATKYGVSCFADDTGLEVEALNGEPGVYSARYAAMDNAAQGDLQSPTAIDNAAQGDLQSPTAQGDLQSPPLSHDSEANMAKLLAKLGENNNRRARFRTIIALVELKGDVCTHHFFQGIVNGEITRQRSGCEGFGYDPIFRPDGYNKTFAELGAEIKNKISHRARATQELAKYLATPNT